MLTVFFRYQRGEFADHRHVILMDERVSEMREGIVDKIWNCLAFFPRMLFGGQRRRFQHRYSIRTTIGKKRSREDALADSSEDIETKKIMSRLVATDIHVNMTTKDICRDRRNTPCAFSRATIISEISYFDPSGTRVELSVYLDYGVDMRIGRQNRKGILQLDTASVWDKKRVDRLRMMLDDMVGITYEEEEFRGMFLECMIGESFSLFLARIFFPSCSSLLSSYLFS